MHCKNKTGSCLCPRGQRGKAKFYELPAKTCAAGGSGVPLSAPECDHVLPKALSGRVLVAAYWLFIVLMLATFTANLAAFLTVERMQTTVQSLEELGRQSRINYTAGK